jgi:hypothetical protein
MGKSMFKNWDTTGVSQELAKKAADKKAAEMGLTVVRIFGSETYVKGDLLWHSNYTRCSFWHVELSDGTRGCVRAPWSFEVKVGMRRGDIPR